MPAWLFAGGPGIAWAVASAFAPPPVPAGEPAPDDVVVESIEEKDGLYLRYWLIKRAGVTVPQHVHDYDHATMVCEGQIRLWVDGEHKGVFHAGDRIEIKAGQLHVFQSLAKNTRLCCEHNIASAESIKRKGL